MQHGNRFLLLNNYYGCYCCRGGKTNELYILADLTTVQALHSSHMPACVFIYTYIIKYKYIYVNMQQINKVYVVKKVIKGHNHSSIMHIIAICR